MITPVNARSEDDDTFLIRTSRRTIGDAQFYITTTPQGMYVIRTEGLGDSPKICKEHFTSLREVRRALDKYEQTNARKLGQKKINKEIAERRKAEYEAKE